MVPSGMKKGNSAGRQSRASQLAAVRAEQLLDDSYTDDDLSGGLHDDPSNPYVGQYYVSWNVEADQPITSCKRVTIMVRCPSSTSAVTAQLVVLVAQTAS
jgi:hypothetical protein